MNTLKPLKGWLPELEAPKRPIVANERIFWTAISLFLFLVCCQIPLFGVLTSKSADPFNWARVILASNRGTLMELGTSPIITASVIMQLLVGGKLISCNMSLREDRELFNLAQLVLSVVICFGSAVAYVLSGTYGQLSMIYSVIVILQLMFSGFMVMFLDDLMTKGYGLGAGISLFIATNICEKIVWSAISPTTIHTINGTEFEGALVALFHFLIVRPNKFQAVSEAFYRSTAPNCTNLVATIAILVLVIYFQGFRVELPIKHRNSGGQVAKFPIKLFYTSNTPNIILAAMTSNMYYLSQILYQRFRSNPFINIIGQWQTLPGGLSKPVGGLAYFISPPVSPSAYFLEPFHTIVYISFVLTSCAVFSRYYLDISGTGPREVAKSIRDQGFIIRGMRDTSIVNVLESYIPTAATLGGLFLGSLTILADFFGAIGSGTGILLAVTIIFQYYEAIAKEKLQMR